MAQVIILAGGFGTRVHHLLPGIPKPMAMVCGKPFIEWVVRFFASYGCNDFLLSTGYLSEVIEEHFAQQPVADINVSCQKEKNPLGTAGGALNCLSGTLPTGRHYLVTNGDSLVFANPVQLLEPLIAGEADAALLGLRLEDATRYGTIEVDQQQRLTAFLEKRPGPGTINVGVYAFNGSALQDQPARRPLSFELDVFPQLAATGRVRVVTTQAPFLDIGTPETLAQAERFIAEHQSHFNL